MAQRFSSTRNSSSNRPAEWLYDEMFAPGSGYGYKADPSKSRRGSVMGNLMDPLTQVQGGADRWGLTKWSNLFGSGGEINDIDALLRSLNWGAVTSKELSRGGRGSGGGYDANSAFGSVVPGTSSMYSSDRPNPGDIQYGEGGLDSWLYGISSHGRDRGRNSLGRNKTDVPGMWFDPENLRFRQDDLQGIETMDQLEDWAQENFGVDAQTLAASSPELLETRQSWYDDPSQFWDAETGMMDVSEIPGLVGGDSAARMESIMEKMGLRREAEARNLSGDMQDLWENEALRNPHLGRTGVGKMLSRVAPELMGLPQTMSGMTPQSPGFDYGLAEALRPFLEDAQYRGGRYGG